MACRLIIPTLACFSFLLLVLVFGLVSLGHAADAGYPASAAAASHPATYYLNKNRQSSGDHEVHRQDCRYAPAPKNRLELGEFTDCREAIREAKRRGYPTADGCSFCAPACDHG